MLRVGRGKYLSHSSPESSPVQNPVQSRIQSSPESRYESRFYHFPFPRAFYPSTAGCHCMELIICGPLLTSFNPSTYPLVFRCPASSETTDSLPSMFAGGVGPPPPLALGHTSLVLGGDKGGECWGIPQHPALHLSHHFK